MLLLPERTESRTVLEARALDFARRLCFKGYENLSEARRKKLWGDAEWFLTDVFEEGCTTWDHGSGKYNSYPCDWFHERFDDKYFPNTDRWNKRYKKAEEPKYLCTLRAICRAAIDLFDDFAGGVWGWTIGDFKRMYDGELPAWFPREWGILGNGAVEWEAMTDETSIAV